MGKTLGNIFRDDSILKNLRLEFRENARPRRQELAREHGFLVDDVADIRCRWHADEWFSLTEEFGPAAAHFIYICNACRDERDRWVSGEEIAGFVKASVSYAYRCQTCGGFVNGFPIIHCLSENDANTHWIARRAQADGWKDKFLRGAEYICIVCEDIFTIHLDASET
jgi:hypothetical protein